MAGRLMIVRRSLRQHALSTTVTVLATALASGLVMAVFALSAQTRAAFEGGTLGFDAVLGARGSPLQLVLNAVFHLDTSPGNVPWSQYTDIAADPRVELALPYAVGDSYRGFRVVGTTADLFARFEYASGKSFALATGRAFDPGAREAVLGATVAQRSGLGYGDTFRPSHGVVERRSSAGRTDAARRQAAGDGADSHDDAHDDDEHDPGAHAEEYVVVGIFETTNTPSDRVVWIPIEGMFRMGGHVLRGAGGEYVPAPGAPIPDEHKEVSAVLLKLRGMSAGFALDTEINRRGKQATLAWPVGRSVAEFFDKLGWMNRVLEVVAYLVVVVAAASILASLYNTMNERRREFAILRALGARRGTLSAIIVLEATAIAAIGSAVGFAVYAAIMAAAGAVVRERAGVVLDSAAFHPALLLVPAGMIALGAVAGWIPARKAYATDVAENLGPAS